MFCGGDGIADPSVLAVFGLTFAPTHDCNISDNRLPGPDGDARITSVPNGLDLVGVHNNTLPTGSVVLLNDPDPAVAEAAADPLRFDSETSIGGEIGVRSQLVNGALALNATAFYYVFDDQQIQNFDVAIFNFSTFNSGETTTKGIDVDCIKSDR